VLCSVWHSARCRRVQSGSVARWPEVAAARPGGMADSGREKGGAGTGQGGPVSVLVHTTGPPKTASPRRVSAQR
jgi:hypothetical protein